MTLDDIKKLIASDESRTLELKKTTGELKDGMHSACAFLNTEGGWLIFGVAPKSLKIIGQEVTDNTQREIAQALAGIDPAVDVHIEYVARLSWQQNYCNALRRLGLGRASTHLSWLSLLQNRKYNESHAARYV